MTGTKTFGSTENRGTFYSVALLFTLFLHSDNWNSVDFFPVILLDTRASCQTLMAPFVLQYPQVGGLCDCKTVLRVCGHRRSRTRSWNSHGQHSKCTQVVESKTREGGLIGHWKTRSDAAEIKGVLIKEEDELRASAGYTPSTARSTVHSIWSAA